MGLKMRIIYKMNVTSININESRVNYLIFCLYVVILDQEIKINLDIHFVIKNYLKNQMFVDFGSLFKHHKKSQTDFIVNYRDIPIIENELHVLNTKTFGISLTRRHTKFWSTTCSPSSKKKKSQK